MVGREGVGQGARDGAAGDRAARADRGLDHRRHRAFPSKGGTRSGWRGNIAASLASRTIVRSRCRCRLPITMPACQWPIGCICRKTGRQIASVGARRVCLRRSASRPSRRSRSSSCAGRARPALPRGVVLMDAGYGNDTELRTDITALGLTYVGRHSIEHHGLAVGHGAAAAKRWSGRGRPPKLMRRDGKHQPISVKELALGLPKRAWRTIKWREGSAEWLSSRFAARARSRRASRLPAHRGPTGRVAADRVARGRGRADQILALDPSERHLLPPPGRYSPNCAGASSATIRSSSRRSGSAILRGADGAASITTPRCASQPTDS